MASEKNICWSDFMWSRFSLGPFCGTQRCNINSQRSGLHCVPIPQLSSHMPSSVIYSSWNRRSYILDCLSFSPLAAPDLPHRLLLNSFSVSVAWRGKDGNNVMQPCSSVSLDSGCCSIIAFPIIELLRCTHSSNLRHKRCRLWAEFNKLPFPPQHTRKGCSSWAVDELYSMEITSQLIL